MQKILVGVSFAVLTTQLTLAAPNEQNLTIGYEHRNYSKDRGERNLEFLEYSNKFNNGGFVAKLSSADRDFGSGVSDRGTEGKLDIYYDWNDYLSTKSGITLSDNTFAFLHKEYRQDFNIKPRKNLVVNLGLKTTEYAKDVDVNAWSSGLSWYSKRVILSYKYTDYNSDEKGNSHGNTLSGKLKDIEGKGNTQLWLGFGTGAYSYEWDPTNSKLSGDFKSITVRREQPFLNNWLLGISAGKNWYETPLDNYYSINGKIDISYKW